MAAARRRAAPDVLGLPPERYDVDRGIMDAITLSQLRKPRAYPAVSLVMPTHRRGPENRQDPIRLRNLLTEVRHRLEADDRVAGDTADDVLHGLRSAADQVDFVHAEDGLILLAAPEGEWHTFAVSQQVDERVVVDNTFATRDLVAAFTRTRRYWLLVLSDQHTTLWDGQGAELAEVTGRGFPIAPMVIEDADERPGRSSTRRAPHGDERHRRFLREILTALDGVLARDRRPVIVAGVTRHQALFEEMAGPLVTVAGRIDGGYDGAPGSLLAELAGPVLDAYEDLMEVAVLAELEAARNARRYAAGLPEVARLTQEGRAAHLVVERGYYAPAVRTEEGFVRVEHDTANGGRALDAVDVVEGMDGLDAAELAAGQVVDDLVDNVVETVMEYGGEVTFVSDGFLVDHDRIALVLRF